MKKIVPFKKDISFETNIASINSISLEYDVKTQKDGAITGTFYIGGDYTIAIGSANLDKFDYKLPFNINVDKKYSIENAEVDINDFYYEVINNKILSVNIELSIDNIEEKEVREMKEENITPEPKDENITKETKVEEQKTEEKTKDEPKEERCIEEDDVPNKNSNVKSLFDNLDENETYAVYKIHIVTENDTIESIMTNYNVTKEALEDYNNLSEVKIGDKIIVPSYED